MGFSETDAYMLGRNESNEDIEPFNGTDLSDVNEHLLAINSIDSSAASDAGDDGNAKSSGFNEPYNFIAVLGSRLSYTLVMIGGMSADNMSGALLDIMFYEATNLCLHQLHVIMASEVKKMDSNEVCKLVKGWLQHVAGVVADNGLVTTLELADQCNNEYQSRCSVGSSSSDADCDGTVVLAVLEEGEPNADLFLGIEEDELVVLYQCFPFLVGKDVSIGAMKALRRVSDGLFKRME
ncbi:hypothetical protein IWW39_003283 [Coemansia spiralis]|uniref:Uncharacterized protein n=1 Tax=Coemansia spiralis TaxID=417178 RepID=A0A9W8GIM3_9FUNG|nr:hypothetical protein IWW39_003283 [Coemansia spiralis]